MANISTVLSKTAPLCFLPNGSVLCYRKGTIKVIREGVVEKIIPIPISFKERILGGNRFLYRLLRLGIRSAEAIDDNHVILSVGNTLFELDIKNDTLSNGWYCGEGIRPLIMTNVKGVKGFSDGVYFGGYLRNREKRPVNIYRRIGQDQWDVVYTFPQGVINHVHNVIADPYRNCLWIFTGDFDESAAIWKATNDFHEVECIVCNDQKYRGCVAYALPEGLLYATDAPYADNYIYLMDVGTLEPRPLYPLHGSCIYGCQWKGKYVFSSSVEGDGRVVKRRTLFYKGSRDRGLGIKDDFVHLYVGNISGGFDEIYKEKKDCLSYLFQLGVFKFPYGINNTDTLFFQPVAINKNDMCLMSIKENSNQ